MVSTSLTMLLLLMILCFDLSSSQMLLFSKTVNATHLVENKAFVIEYKLYNPTETVIRDIVADDSALFDRYAFSIVSGNLQNTFNSVAPGEHITYEMSLKPHFSGTHNDTPAVARYNLDGERRVVFSTEIGPQMYIWPADEYERHFGSRRSIWATFGTCVIIAVILPYLLLNRLASVYNKA